MTSGVSKTKQQKTFWKPRDRAIRDILNNDQISDHIKERLLKRQIARLQANWTDADRARHAVTTEQAVETQVYHIQRVERGAWDVRSV